MTATIENFDIDSLNEEINRLAVSLGGSVEDAFDKATRFEFSNAELTVFGRLKNLVVMYDYATDSV